MPDLTAMTRQEKFLNGDTDMEPITRREYFYAGRESELPEGHQEPETREEWFIQKYRGGGGDVTVVPLSVTDNGTYSEEGKAYSPVSVNVPLPQNAYLLKSVNTPTPIASFTDGEEMVMPTLKVAIEPQQEGSGDPSPTNIRPISGWDECEVTRCGKNHFDKKTFTVKKFLTSDGRIVPSDNWSISDYIGVKGGTAYILSGVANAGTAAYHCFYDKDKNFISSVISTTQNFTTPSSAVYVRLSMKTETPDAVQLELGNTATEYHAYNGHTYTIDLDGTRYGGELDVVSGVLTVDRAYVDLGTLNYSYYSGNLFTAQISDLKPVPNTRLCNALCSIYVAKQGIDYASIDGSFVAGFNNASTLAIHDSRFTDTTAFKTAMNGVQLVYELATPLTIQLTPTQVKSLLGSNNVWANTGDIKDAEYFSKEV